MDYDFRITTRRYKGDFMSANKQLSGPVRFDGAGYVPVSEKIAGKSRKVVMLAAIFKDSAGKQVAGLSHKELDEWIDRGVRPVRLKFDIPREVLGQGRAELAAMEQAFYLPERTHSDSTH